MRDNIYATLIDLMYGFMRVTIKGNHLQPVIVVLTDRRCSFIQQFVHGHHLPPAPDAPVIEHINVSIALPGMMKSKHRG